MLPLRLGIALQGAFESSLPTLYPFAIEAGLGGPANHLILFVGQIMNNVLASELRFMHRRLFESDWLSAASETADHTRNGEHNSCKWLYGHIGFITDDLILRAWQLNGSSQIITTDNFGYDSDGKKDVEISFFDIQRETSRLILMCTDKLNQDGVANRLALQSSLSQNFETDLHVVVHAIQDIAYHSGQVSLIANGKTAK